MIIAGSKKVFTVARLAEICGAELIGSGSTEIVGMAPIKSASDKQISFISEEKYLQDVPQSRAAAIIVTEKIDNAPMPLLIVKNVEAAVIDVLAQFVPVITPPPAGIHNSAVVEAGAVVDSSAAVGALAFVASGAQIGANTVISPGCKIGQNTKIGNDCRIEANVVVYHHCSIGNNCIIGANTTIGSMGFGYSFIDGAHKPIPHTGGVVIEDFVDIGAGCCIDRAKFGNTVIGAGTKMDNLIQIGHNVTIGKCSLIVSLVGIGGSSKIGNGVVIAGQVGLKNHVEIGDGARVGAQAGVINNIPPGSDYVGSPAIDVKEKIRQVLATQKLPETLKDLKQLTKRVEKLESAKNNS